MPTINTAKISKLRLSKNRILLLVFLLLLFSGCGKKDELGLARNDAAMSEVNYQHATERYKLLIAKGSDLDRMHFELGRLYYEYGDFDKAIEQLKKTNFIHAVKLLALSYYKIGNYTEALAIFNQKEIPDDEYLYYRALTCEKLNLFDQALAAYKMIKGKAFKAVAEGRIQIIEKQANLNSIKEIDPNVYKIITGAPAEQNYPQASALILSCEEKVEITNEAREISSLHYVIKILNERGKENFSETRIEYDSTYEKVELIYARTIKPDGSVIDVGTRHIRDVSKYLNFPLYSNVHVYIISFPEITERAVIEYKLKIYNNKLINKKDFVLDYTVQSHEPIISANFSVQVPKDRKLNLKTLNEKFNDFSAKLSPNVEEKGEFLTYSWGFKDIPAIIPESNMPPDVRINPVVLLSTFNSWQEIYDWWWQLAKDKIKADEAIKKKVRELTKRLVSDEDKIRAIYNFCAQNIRYVAVEYGQAGFEPHSAGDIFMNKYGDCKDQAILLVTMLKEANLLGYPVLIATNEYYNLSADFPSVLFNHCIAAVKLADEVIFLDPTAQTCSFRDLPPGDQARKVLIFKEEGFEIKDTPLYQAGHNLIKQVIDIKVDKDESIAAQKSIHSFGYYDQAERYWLLYTQPDLIEEAIKVKIQEISIGAKLDGYNIKNLEDLNKPVELDYSFKGNDYFTIAGNLRILPQLAGLDTSQVAKEKRKYPIDYNALDSKEIIFEIAIPENFVVKYIPGTVNEDSPWLSLIVEYSQKNNKLYFRQRADLKKITVLESEYPDFKRFFEACARKLKQRIVLEKIK